MQLHFKVSLVIEPQVVTQPSQELKFNFIECPRVVAIDYVREAWSNSIICWSCWRLSWLCHFSCCFDLPFSYQPNIITGLKSFKQVKALLMATLVNYEFTLIVSYCHILSCYLFCYSFECFQFSNAVSFETPCGSEKCYSIDYSIFPKIYFHYSHWLLYCS